MCTSRNGNDTKCVRHEMAMIQNVYVTKWQCYKMSTSRNGNATKCVVCTSRNGNATKSLFTKYLV